MGAWGTYPQDSDGALDLFGDVCSLVNENMEKLSKDYDDYEYAGAIVMLLQKGFHVKIELVEKAIECVKKSIENIEQVGWKDEEKAIESMNTVLDGFNELLAEHATLHSVLAPIGWLLRDSEKEKTNWSGMGFVD